MRVPATSVIDHGFRKFIKPGRWDVARTHALGWENVRPVNREWRYESGGGRRGGEGINHSLPGAAPLGSFETRRLLVVRILQTLGKDISFLKNGLKNSYTHTHDSIVCNK